MSEQTGDFSWSYPLRVPPSPGGLQPSLALSYRSSAVDGRTSATNNQASWIGDGWDLWPGFIERTYGGCADDTEGGTTPPKTGDLCWRSDNATAAFAGGGGMLIRDDATGMWKSKSDNGSRVERFTGIGNGDDNGEHWRITTIEGTQYWFGSQAGSSSTWTVPVFGDDAGEPCHGTRFDASHCVQAYRWNLDKVIDRHGNAVRYYYTTESNNYGLNLKDTAVSYIRGGTLQRVEYGLHESLPGNPATGRVLFVTADRCVKDSVCTQDRKPNYPDTPLDSRCDTTCKDHYSPTFWSTQRLASVTTQVWRGSAYADVDRWTLGQEFPDPGDGEKAALWLKTITHTGLVGGSIELPAVIFEGSKTANRVYKVDGAGPLNRYRVTGVISETGGVTSVIYAPPECRDGGPIPTNPESNTLRCYPQRWTKKDWAERTDYFHKYVVAKIVQSDRLSTSTEQVTSYEYLDGAAWHWDMSEFTKDDKKTWNEFRGFGRVRVRTGAPNDPAGPISLSEQRFYRGMDADRLPSGTRSITVTDSEGGRYTDHDWLQGFGLETAVFNGENGPVVTKSLTAPTWQGPLATRGPYKSYLVTAGIQRDYTALESGGWRITRGETTYDDKGLPTQVNDLGEVTKPDDDRCTHTTYTRNTDRWLINFPSNTETVSVHCGQTPRFPEHALTAGRTSYDGQNPGLPPTVGNVTRSEVANDRPPSGPVYATVGTSRYDSHGRVTEATDPLDHTTKSAFTPPVGGPVTQTTLTTPPTAAVPAGLTTTQTIDPAFGQPTLVVDPNGRKTELTYDALGRKTEVWLPNRLRSTNPQGNARFAYQLRNDNVSVVTTAAIGPNGNYTSTSQLFDGFLRPRQVQAPAVGGGRLLTDTRYDSHGRAYKSTQPYFNNATVDTTLWVASDTEVPGLTRIQFDGADRPLAQIYQGGATEKWRTTTAYGGDRIHVTPPQGGTPTTSITDARGQTIERRHYAASTPTGTYDATRYTYTSAGKIAEVTDPAGNSWRYFYDRRGRQVRAEDPDKGAATSTYDNADRLTSTKDARNVTLANSYDSLGRLTATFMDRVGGTKLSEWVYDTALFGKGQLASMTRYVNGNAYTNSVYSYTGLYLPTETTVTIPQAEGALAGSYTWFGAYGWDGSLSGESYPAAGGLPKETVNYVLDDWGRPTTTSGAYNGTVDLVTDTAYTRYGEPQRVQLGTVTRRAWLSYYYDDQTRRVTRSIVDAEVPRPMQTDTHYTYDRAGNITSIVDRPLEQSPDVQCFRHDHLRRLSEAWTPGLDTWSETTGCQDAPAVAGLSGPAPYWHSYSYDQVGNRLTEVQHATGGDTTRTYTYPAAGGPQPHSLSSVTTTRPGQPAVTNNYSYDTAGNTISRTGETLSWDAEGHLASLTKNGTTTSFVYGADGQRLLRKDPTGTTLYLGKQEIRLPTGSATPAATRYYTHGGQTIAVRQGSTLTWLANDHQASPQISINSATLQVTRRRQLPFGAPRGTEPPSWPGERGFVGGTLDTSTGLTHLGAREYDPALGRFISVDPIMDLTDPQQMHGYSYSNNSPITFADPKGLRPICGMGDECGYEGAAWESKPSKAQDTANKRRAKSAAAKLKTPVRNREGKVLPGGTVDTLRKTFDYRGSDDFTYADAIQFARQGNAQWGIVCQWMNGIDACKQMRPDMYKDAAGAMLHGILDVVGFVPIIGEAADGFNALLYLGEGDLANAGISLTGVLPLIGDASKAATRYGDEVAGSFKTACSFIAGTQVLMADGTHKSIEKVEAGDKVLATDPETRETGPRVVLTPLSEKDLKTFVQISIDTGGPARGQTGTLTATDNHPFWSPDLQKWIPASELRAGSLLQTSAGTKIQVTAVRKWTAIQTVHNLSVDDIHTYYVVAGETAILVHNQNKMCGVGDFRAGDMFYHAVQTEKGLVEMMAGVHVDGRALHLSDVAVYGTGDMSRGSLGQGDMLKELRTVLAPAAAAQGFDTLRITAVRASGNPGHQVDLSIDLTRYRR